MNAAAPAPELLSIDDWQATPASEEIHGLLGYLKTFLTWSMQNPFDVELLHRLKVPQIQMIAQFHAWRVRKGKAHQDLIDRKSMLDEISSALSSFGNDAYLARLNSKSRDELQSLCDRAGMPGAKYARKAQRADSLLNWHKLCLSTLRAKIAESAWIIVALEALKSGRPINLETAQHFHIREIAVKNFMYEESGSLLVKGDGKRWVVPGMERKYTQEELAASLASSEKSLLTFDAQTLGLDAELAILKKASAPLSADQQDRLDFLARIQTRRIDLRANIHRRVTDLRAAVARTADLHSTEFISQTLNLAFA